MYLWLIPGGGHLGGVRWGNFYMISVEMLVGKFKLNHLRRLMCMVRVLLMAPKRYHLKQNRLDYKPVFRNEVDLERNQG